MDYKTFKAFFHPRILWKFEILNQYRVTISTPFFPLKCSPICNTQDRRNFCPPKSVAIFIKAIKFQIGWDILVPVRKKKNLIQLWTKKILKKGKGSGKAKIRRKRRRKKKKEKKRREERVEKKKEEKKKKKKGKKEKEKIKREGKEEENKKKKLGFTDLQLFPQHTVALLGW